MGAAISEVIVVRGSSLSAGYHKRRSGDQRRLTRSHTPCLFRLSANRVAFEISIGQAQIIVSDAQITVSRSQIIISEEPSGIRSLVWF